MLLFYLSGPMIFGVAKAISREHNLINDYQALVLDLSEVLILGVTSSVREKVSPVKVTELKGSDSQ